MIEVHNLTKYYGTYKALDNLSFSIQPGLITGFLGPNGAGKSTTMNILTGYLAPSSGYVSIDGLDVIDDPIVAKRKIGYLPEHPPLYLELTVAEYLFFVCELRGFRPRSYTDELNSIIEETHLTKVVHRLIRNLSKGYRQRVGLAAALIGKPPVLILDEPTVGLDPKQLLQMRALITKLKQNHTIIFSSHILSEVEATCDTVLIINQGRLVAFDTPANLSKNRHASKHVMVRLAGSELLLANTLKRRLIGYKIDNLGSCERGTVDFRISHATQHDIRSVVFSALVQLHLTVLSFGSSQGNLEASFLTLIEQEE